MGYIKKEWELSITGHIGRLEPSFLFILCTTSHCLAAYQELYSCSQLMDSLDPLSELNVR